MKGKKNYKKNPQNHTRKREKESGQDKPQRDELKSYFLFDKLRTGGIAKVLLLPALPTSVVDVITETFCTIFKQLFVIADVVYCF